MKKNLKNYFIVVPFLFLSPISFASSFQFIPEKSFNISHSQYTEFKETGGRYIHNNNFTLGKSFYFKDILPNENNLEWNMKTEAGVGVSLYKGAELLSNKPVKTTFTHVNLDFETSLASTYFNKIKPEIGAFVSSEFWFMNTLKPRVTIRNGVLAKLAYKINDSNEISLKYKHDLGSFVTYKFAHSDYGKTNHKQKTKEVALEYTTLLNSNNKVGVEFYYSETPQSEYKFAGTKDYMDYYFHEPKNRKFGINFKYFY